MDSEVTGVTGVGAEVTGVGAEFTGVHNEQNQYTPKYTKQILEENFVENNMIQVMTMSSTTWIMSNTTQTMMTAYL